MSLKSIQARIRYWRELAARMHERELLPRKTLERERQEKEKHDRTLVKWQQTSYKTFPQPTAEQWEAAEKRLRGGRQAERLQEFRENNCFDTRDLQMFNERLYMPTPSEIDAACVELRGKRLPDEVDATATFADVLQRRWGSNWQPVFALSQHNAKLLLGPDLCDCPYWGTEFTNEEEWEKKA